MSPSPSSATTPSSSSVCPSTIPAPRGNRATDSPVYPGFLSNRAMVSHFALPPNQLRVLPALPHAHSVAVLINRTGRAQGRYRLALVLAECDQQVVYLYPVPLRQLLPERHLGLLRSL